MILEGIFLLLLFSQELVALKIVLFVWVII